jgi:hypothetical protein
MLLDLCVFGANTFLTGILAMRFYEIAVSAKNGDGTSLVIVFFYFLSLAVLAPAGAVLDRWHFHQRVSTVDTDWSEMANGCAFNPLIYFAVLAVLDSMVAHMLLGFVYGDAETGSVVNAAAAVAALVAASFQTFLIYRYFTAPSHVPRSQFMLGPASEALGTVCIFLNMLLVQVLWNIFALGLERPKNGYDIFTSLLALSVGSLIIHFPPRIFYLAEDAGKRRTWLFILLANVPVIYRAVFGNAHALRF